MQAGQCAQCCSYLARGLSLPLIGGGKTNSVPAKRAGSVFITAKKKALFPASPQRLFITHTRGWRKCSICWVRPSTHTVYKLRAFTCRVPEIKHTHTKERGVLYRPRRSASPLLSLCPGRRWLSFRNSTLSQPVSSFLSREQLCFCLPAATSGKRYAGCQPSEPGGWHVLPLLGVLCLLLWGDTGDSVGLGCSVPRAACL